MLVSISTKGKPDTHPLRTQPPLEVQAPFAALGRPRGAPLPYIGTHARIMRAAQSILKDRSQRAATTSRQQRSRITNGPRGDRPRPPARCKRSPGSATGRRGWASDIHHRVRPKRRGHPAPERPTHTRTSRVVSRPDQSLCYCHAYTWRVFVLHPAEKMHGPTPIP